ncbi:hypothetical protein [Mycobacterium sp. HM-7]
MMPHARLFAASSLVTAGLLALGPEAVVALADTDSGSSSTGGSTTGSSGTTGTTTGTTTGGTTTGSDTSTTTGGSTTTGSTTTGSSTSSTTGSSSSPNLQTTLGGMVGQFTRIIQHPTSIIGGAPLTGLVPGVKPKPGQNAPLLPPGASSTFSASVPAPTNGAPQPSAAAAPEPTKNSQDANVATEPKAPLAQLPLAVAQVPLTALDLVKTTIPTVVEAVPIPGLAALPVFADALINPIESTVRDLAVAASNLPFLQYTPGMPAIQLPPDNRTLQLNAPQMPKTFGASTDSVPRDISPGTPGTLDKPVPPVQPRDVFAAETHLVAAKDFRPGYPDYLRAAGLSEVAAVAVPGFAGIITLTAAGGLIGFRQARATSSAPARAQRFVN